MSKGEVTREEIDNWIAGATVEYLEQSYEKKIKQALLRLLDDADLEIRDYTYGVEEK